MPERKIKPPAPPSITRKRHRESPASGLRIIRRLAHSHWQYTSGLEYRGPGPSWKAGISDPRLVIRSAFNLHPITIPSDWVCGLIRYRKQRESQIVAGKIGVTNECHRDRGGCRGRVASEEENCKKRHRAQDQKHCRASELSSHSYKRVRV